MTTDEKKSQEYVAKVDSEMEQVAQGCRQRTDAIELPGGGIINREWKM